MINGVIKKIRARGLKAWVAQNPNDSKFYGIDRVLQVPITEGYKTQKQAEKAWFTARARAILSICNQDYNI